MRSLSHGTFVLLLYVLLDLVVWNICHVVGQAQTATDEAQPRTMEESTCEMVRRPSSAKHVVVLVHGIMGTHKELSYVKEALEREFKLALSLDDEFSKHFLVHAASCNDDNTLDGIEAGGRRLAIEINELLRNETKDGHVALSMLGNSLGGLYARYALPYIDWNRAGQTNAENLVFPNVFITTATPHLGLRDMTILPLPRSIQSAGASRLKTSGKDLFQFTDTIHQMCLDPEFLRPLAKFSKRIAFANTFSTDAPVITSTAAFLSESSSSLHHLVETSFGDRHPDKDFGVHVHSPYPAIRLETENTFVDALELVEDYDPSMPPDDEGVPVNVELYSKRLDSLGWTKIFVDVRSHIPALWSRGQSRRVFEDMVEEKTQFTSGELYSRLSPFDWNTLPFAHSFMVASAKNSIYRWFYSGGRPLVDRIARELVREMLGEPK